MFSLPACVMIWNCESAEVVIVLPKRETWLVPVCHADCVCLHRPSFVSRGDWTDIGGCDYNEILAVVPLMDTAANPLAFVPRSETYFDASGEANVAALFYGRRILLFAFRPVAGKERLLLYDGW